MADLRTRLRVFRVFRTHASAWTHLGGQPGGAGEGRGGVPAVARRGQQGQRRHAQRRQRGRLDCHKACRTGALQHC